mgnify:CR=1 FL=1
MAGGIGVLVYVHQGEPRLKLAADFLGHGMRELDAVVSLFEFGKQSRLAQRIAGQRVYQVPFVG